MMAAMKATSLIDERVYFSERKFADIVIWLLPKPAMGSAHPFKYRLAYVVDKQCVMRYDNEVGKGDHRHLGPRQTTYRFTTLKRLIADFDADIERWNNENSDI